MTTLLVQQMRDSTHFEDMSPDVTALMRQGADEIERQAEIIQDAVIRLDDRAQRIEELGKRFSDCSSWISVEERVPESEIPTWVVTNSKRRLVAEFGDDEWWVWQSNGVKVRDYLENVTHWMPLPEAPK